MKAFIIKNQGITWYAGRPVEDLSWARISPRAQLGLWIYSAVNVYSEKEV
jgi:hypothetical protein